MRSLQAAGHQVTAFYLQIWFQDDFRNFWDSCPWEEDLSYCRQVSTASSALSAEHTAAGHAAAADPPSTSTKLPLEAHATDNSAGTLPQLIR